jgi:hypothetical protein
MTRRDRRKWGPILGKKVLAAFVPAVLAALLILAGGCGAYNPSGSSTGTGGTGGTSSPGAAQGFYSTTLQSGPPNMEALILSDDTFWGVFGNLTSSSFGATAMATGKGASTTSGYSVTLNETTNGNTTFTGALTATDVPGESISGTVPISGAQTGFGGTALSSPAYTYSTPASIATIAGAWSGSLLDGSVVTLSISTSGGITTTSTGCQVSGTITADTSHNFYTVNLGFGASPCVLASQNATGIAVIYLLPDGATTQLLMPVVVGTTGGTVFTAEK